MCKLNGRTNTYEQANPQVCATPEASDTSCVCATPEAAETLHAKIATDAKKLAKEAAHQCLCTHEEAKDKEITKRLDITTDQLKQVLHELHQPMFRVKQIEEWLWQKNVRSFDEMTNLPQALRTELAKRFVQTSIEIIDKQVSRDGSRKYLIRFPDKTITECVGMPTKDKLSVCVSTQAGCAIGCVFCATGRGGLTRSLSDNEIYEQALCVRDDFKMRISSIVLMGQGEPLANYKNSVSALMRFNSPEGLGIGARHLTISTCGIIPNIIKFSHEKEQFTLAVSLHSAVQKTRDYLMPGVKRFSLLALHEALQTYTANTNRRPSYEYALIKGINDTPEELQALCDFCAGTLAHVNLIQLNKIDDSPFEPTSEACARHFVERLRAVGVEATIRKSRGADIDAACGQLKEKTLKQKLKRLSL